jgi:hypothetical protein
MTAGKVFKFCTYLLLMEDVLTTSIIRDILYSGLRQVPVFHKLLHKHHYMTAGKVFKGVPHYTTAGRIFKSLHLFTLDGGCADNINYKRNFMFWPETSARDSQAVTQTPIESNFDKREKAYKRIDCAF